MLEPTARIIVHRTTNNLGLPETLRYEWEGGIVARMSYPAWRDVVNLDSATRIEGQRFRLGTLRLRILSYEWNTQVIEVVRDGALWIVINSLHKSLRLLDLAYRRLIITAAVWNLARHEIATIPTWRDIYALRAVENACKRFAAHWRRLTE